MRFLTRSCPVLAVGLLVLASPGRAQVANDDRSNASEPKKIDFGFYLDLGYGYSSNQPANNRWRTKSTTFIVDQLKVNNITLAVRKGVTRGSRWGYRLGLQAGVDVDGLVPSESAMSNAETLKHLWYTNLTYGVPLGNHGAALTLGLIPGNAGYPSYHSIRNPSYTRPYEVDYVPYFWFGLRATYPATDAPISGSLYIVNGYDYLAAPNDIPSYGLQVAWNAAEDLSFTQNLYYGSDQAATSLEYWRFMSDTNAELLFGPFLLAGSLTFGTEKQAAVTGTPNYGWVAGALWFQWQPRDAWKFTVRPEFFDDPDGLMTGARQTIGAVAASAEYRYRPNKHHLIAARLEYRFDRSNGDEGGFYDGPQNQLVPDQQLIIASLTYEFDHRFVRVR